ncbi:MAG: TfoX/Sxy family protein [Pyrinomonadaceae bacterium]
MAFDETLGRRIAASLEATSVEFVEKRMFGGLGFMINDKMCIGVVKDDLMVRVLEDKFDDVLAMPNVRPMDFTGRTMKGFVYVEADGIRDAHSLKTFVDLALEFAKFGVVKSKMQKPARK